MRSVKEITVSVTSDYNTLVNSLTKEGFKYKEEYIMKDVYMINSDINLNKLSSLEILKKCILVREIKNIKKALLYKKKEYDTNGDILNEIKIECPVDDTLKAIEFMRSINYDILFTIDDICTVYEYNDVELCIQRVNDKYIFIELETFKNQTIDELKAIINSFDLPIDKSNYFVKKAEIILNEKNNVE